MASPPLAELAPQRTRSGLGKTELGRGQAPRLLLQLLELGLQSPSPFLGWVSPPGTLTPAVLAVGVPLIAICAFLQGDQQWPAFTPCPLQLTRPRLGP